MSVLHGRAPWQLPLLWVQAPLHPTLAPHPLPRHSLVAVQPSQLCRQSAAGHQRSNSAVPCHNEGSGHTKLMEDSQPLLMHCGLYSMSVEWHLKSEITENFAPNLSASCSNKDLPTLLPLGGFEEIF